MSFTQYHYITDMAISRNNEAAPLFEGTLEFPLLDVAGLAAANAGLAGAGDIPSGAFYTYRSTADPATDTWAAYVDMVDKSSKELRGVWIAEQLEMVGDKLYYYNRRIGKTFAIVLELAEDAGTYKTVKRGIRYNGTDVMDANNRVIDGEDVYGRNRAFLLGALIDIDAHEAMVWDGVAAHHKPATVGDTCGCEYLNAWTRADFDKYKYAYFALFSGYLPPSEDPYAPAGYSNQAGGDGGFDDSSDVISVPEIPALNLSLNHFISAYVPDLQDINDLGDWIWSNFDKTDVAKLLSKILTSPMDAILSLHMLPFTPDSSTDIPVTIGNFSTNLQMAPLTTQFKDIDCGSLTFDKYWGNYLDHNPFTKIILCLCYVGQVDLDPDEVMGKTVSVRYRVDCLTGAFVCFVYIDGDKVLGQYSGNCALQVPVTSGSYAQMNAALLAIASSAASSFAGAAGGAIGGGYGGMLAAKEGLRLGAGALGETMSSAAGNVNGMKLKTSHSGGLTSTAGFLGVQKPYVIMHRPKQSLPEDYNAMAGYPSNMTKVLSNCVGFTSVRTMVYDGIPFTDEEIRSLDEILKGGIFI